MDEIWKPIKGLEGLYEVSNQGNIKNIRTGKIRKPSDNGNGYLQIMLNKKHFYIHRLVAETFLPNPDNLPQVNHKIEGDKGKKINIVYLNEDGSVNKEKSTIEWCDGKYNHNYGTINERISKANTNGKCSKPILQFSKAGEFIREFPSIKEACRITGFFHQNIQACCSETVRTCKNYIFIYKYLNSEEYLKYRVNEANKRLKVKFTKEHIEKIQKKLTNGKLSKPVLQFTLDGEFIREWPSTAECGRNGFNQRAVCSCCNGKKPQYKGFIWKYS